MLGVRHEHRHLVVVHTQTDVVAAVHQNILSSHNLFVLAGVRHHGVDVFLYEHGRSPVAESHLARFGGESLGHLLEV